MPVKYKYFARWKAGFGVLQEPEAPPPPYVLPQVEREMLLFSLRLAEFWRRGGESGYIAGSRDGVSLLWTEKQFW